MITLSAFRNGQQFNCLYVRYPAKEILIAAEILQKTVKSKRKDDENTNIPL